MSFTAISMRITRIGRVVGAGVLLLAISLSNSSEQLAAEQNSNTAQLPRLELEVQGNEILLRYPISASDYMLQSTDSLVSPVEWTMITNTPVPRGDQLTVTLIESSVVRFYRLHQVTEISESDHASHHQ